MSTLTVRSNAVMNKKTGNAVKSRLADYFVQNQKTFILGLYAISGRVPSSAELHALGML